MAWLHGSDSSPGHLPPRVDPVVSSVISALRSSFGVQRLGGVGYCFGAKYVIRFLRENTEALDAGFVAHPSFVTAEELGKVRGPLSIAAGGDDAVFPASKRRETEEILKGKVGDGEGAPWQLCLFGGVDHGFAVRCDVTERRQRFAMKQAFFQAVAWFGEFL
jgi:dienelactone hydrolase